MTSVGCRSGVHWMREACAPLDRLGDRAREHGLGRSGHVLEQHVAAAGSAERTSLISSRLPRTTTRRCRGSGRRPRSRRRSSRSRLVGSHHHLVRQPGVEVSRGTSEAAVGGEEARLVSRERHEHERLLRARADGDLSRHRVAARDLRVGLRRPPRLRRHDDVNVTKTCRAVKQVAFAPAGARLLFNPPGVRGTVAFACRHSFVPSQGAGGYAARPA